MDEPQTTEFLSAYFDDELPLDRRAEVESRLNHSPELRTELDEIAGLSNLLNSLPRQSAPPDLATSIMRQVERDFALRRPIIRPLPVAARAWTAVVSSLFVTAAALFAMLPLLRQAPQPSRSAGEGMAAHSAPAAGDAVMSLDHSVAEADEDGDGLLGLRTEGTANETTTSRRNGRAMSRREAQSQPAASEVEMERNIAAAARMRAINGTDVFPAVPAPLADTPRSTHEALKGIAASQLAQFRDEIAVVEVYCDDVASGMTKLREVLLNHSIQPLVEPDAKVGISHERAEANQAGMPEAVYVEASPRQLNEAFTELRQQPVLGEIVQIENMNWNEILVERTDGDSNGGRGIDDKPFQQESLAENVKRLRDFAENTDAASEWGAVKKWRTENGLLFKPDLRDQRGTGKFSPSAPTADRPAEEESPRSSAAPLANQSRQVEPREKQESAITAEPMQRKASAPHSAAIAERPVEVDREVFFQHAFQVPVQLPRSVAALRDRQRRQQVQPSPLYAEGDAAGLAIARRQREVTEKDKSADTPAEAPVRVMFVLQQNAAARDEAAKGLRDQ